MIPSGRSFYKMTGSGNDFIVIDARHDPIGELADTAVVRRLCARGTGVGADGIVLLESSATATIRLVYLNADGSRADFCGNATLCTTRLACELGIGKQGSLTIETDAGVIAARITEALPEIDLQPVCKVQQAVETIGTLRGEQRIGFALAGVPHLTILCDDVSTVDVVGRGRPLRHHGSLAHGANVNFVSRVGGSSDGWRMRTYERGVEGETLACGSGAVATAILLTAWNEANGPVQLETKSGKPLRVRLSHDESTWKPSLSGEGRIVYRGVLAET
jgi:diaminopimelate epimerase